LKRYRWIERPIYESRKGQDAKRKVDTFCKEGAVYHDYFAEIEKDLLSELEKEERDERVIAARAEQHRLYRELVTRQEDIISVYKDSDRKTNLMYKDMWQRDNDRLKHYENMHKKYAKFIQERLDHVDTMEGFLLKDELRLEKRRMGLAMEVVAKGVMQEAVAFIKNTKKRRKLKWGGPRRGVRWDAVNHLDDEVKGMKDEHEKHINHLMKSDLSIYVPAMGKLQARKDGRTATKLSSMKYEVYIISGMGSDRA